MLQMVPKQRIFNVPTSVVVVVALLIAVFAVQANVGELTGLEILRQLAFVPARVSYFLDPTSLQKILEAANGAPDSEAQIALTKYFLEQGRLQPWTLLTYALLHHSWSDVIFHSVILLTFGVAIARRFGSVRFIVFLAFVAVAGAAVHFAMHPLLTFPLVGASAVISGCMGAALRFAFAPGAPLGKANGLSFLNPEAAYHLPAPTLKAVFQNQRAMGFLAIWLSMNLLIGLLSLWTTGNVAFSAWEAHVGGLIAGFALFGLFDRARR